MLRKLQIANSLAFIVAAVLCTAFCLTISRKPENSRSGVFTLTASTSDLPFVLDSKLAQFNIPTIHLPDTVLTSKEHTNKPRGNLFDSVQSKLQSAAGFAATGIPSAISDAIHDAEAAVNSLIPKNCTLGTDYLCVGLGDSINCSPLPLNNSHPISRALSNLQLPNELLPTVQPIIDDLESLERTISGVPFEAFKIYFKFGLCVAILAIILGVLFLCSLWLEALRIICYVFRCTALSRVICHVFGPVVAILRAFVSFLCFLAFLIPSVFLWILPSKFSKLPFEVELGGVRDYCVGAFILASIMFTLAIVSEVIAKRLRLQ